MGKRRIVRRGSASLARKNRTLVKSLMETTFVKISTNWSRQKGKYKQVTQTHCSQCRPPGICRQLLYVAYRELCFFSFSLILSLANYICHLLFCSPNPYFTFSCTQQWKPLSRFSQFQPTSRAYKSESVAGVVGISRDSGPVQFQSTKTAPRQHEYCDYSEPFWCRWIVAFHCGARWFYFPTLKRSLFGKDHISLFFCSWYWCY